MAGPNALLSSYSLLQSLVLDSAAEGSDCPHVLIYSVSFCKHTQRERRSKWAARQEPWHIATWSGRSVFINIVQGLFPEAVPKSLAYGSSLSMHPYSLICKDTTKSWLLGLEMRLVYPEYSSSLCAVLHQGAVVSQCIALEWDAV